MSSKPSTQPRKTGRCTSKTLSYISLTLPGTLASGVSSGAVRAGSAGRATIRYFDISDFEGLSLYCGPLCLNIVHLHALPHFVASGSLLDELGLAG
ncbi:hypothetical protein M011DRAFT_471148 [Sporormia fimetaria CBS 119925]|uniref:Uncharacterized protein n=1 Tax=Sporormia fimetaria CBS 119925 TaxID=1340428 RepID=A0A6A6V272_9PLEO|nr:hypothetical protein M011DRAFT_471148 [Sporormia fimetaria CBS 119925]